MEIAVAPEGAFAVAPSISAEEARGRAGGYIGTAFGGIAQLFSKPKPGDVAVELRGLRYRPLWHAHAHVRLAYDRRETYHFPVKSPDHVRSLTIGGAEFALDGDRKDRGISVSAMAHCLRETSKELWIDAVSGETVAAPRFGGALPEPVEVAAFAPADAELVEPSVRASAVVRLVLGDDVTPPEADHVGEARAEIDRLDLYFLPVYAFGLVWAAKNKTVEVSCDGATGEVAQAKAGAHPLLGKLLHKETLFDLGSETLNLVVPGSAIPLKIVQALASRDRR